MMLLWAPTGIGPTPTGGRPCQSAFFQALHLFGKRPQRAIAADALLDAVDRAACAAPSPAVRFLATTAIDVLRDGASILPMRDTRARAYLLLPGVRAVAATGIGAFARKRAQGSENPSSSLPPSGVLFQTPDSDRPT